MPKVLKVKAFVGHKEPFQCCFIIDHIIHFHNVDHVFSM